MVSKYRVHIPVSRQSLQLGPFFRKFPSLLALSFYLA